MKGLGSSFRGASARARALCLIVYAAAMGWLEAVVVVYIRAILGIARAEGMPAANEVMERFRTRPWLMPTEQTREAATLVMLAAVAWLAAGRWRPRFGAFLICFGVWDITYYVGLYALLGWPSSLANKDLLFLIPPTPLWYQPVWLPVAISCLMVGSGLVLLLRSAGVRARGLPAAR